MKIEAIFHSLPSVSSLALAAAVACTSVACGGTAPVSSAAASTTTGGTTEDACVNNLPQSCPATVPSYQTDIVPIIQSGCLECHSAGGIGAVASRGPGGFPGGGGPAGGTTTAGTTGGTATNPNAIASNPNRPNFDPNTARFWGDINNIERSRQQILQDVFLCRMPPDPGTPLSSADRLTLMTWLVCGAPNN